VTALTDTVYNLKNHKGPDSSLVTVANANNLTNKKQIT